MADLSEDEKKVLKAYIGFHRIAKYIETEHPMYKFISTHKLNLVFKKEHGSEIDKEVLKQLYDKDFVELRRQGMLWYVGIDITKLKKLKKELGM